MGQAVLRRRYRGLRDRSSRPHSSPSQTPLPGAPPSRRCAGSTGKQIAAEIKVSTVTVSRILRRSGLTRIHDLESVEPVRRYEREQPGELIPIYIKKHAGS